MALFIHPTADEMASRQKSRVGRSRYEVHQVGVLGAGTMGARIAAHIANAGLPVLLFDLPSSGVNSNSIALGAIDGLRKTKPAAFADPAVASLITVGNFDDDLGKLKECDWIIEAVVENLEIKQTLLAKVATHLSDRAILTTNTSGLPVGKIGEQLPDVGSGRGMTRFENPQAGEGRIAFRH